MTYRQITSNERHAIAALLRQGMSLPEIAKNLGRHRSTIWREVHRNGRWLHGAYIAQKACERARGRRTRCRRGPRFSVEERELIFDLMAAKWSPEQIAGTLRRSGLLRISHETIYRWIWEDKWRGGKLHLLLRQAVKKKRKRYAQKDSRGRLGGKRHITERPPSAEKRSRQGHWEMDTVLGKGSKHCLVTLVDRKTRFTLIGKLRARTKDEVNRVVPKLLVGHPVKTITADNGTEFHGYRELEKSIGTRIYFATPYHSWERGTNENTNGLIRQYVPKRSNMRKLTQSQCDEIARDLNTRPRKTLGYRTPERCHAIK